MTFEHVNAMVYASLCGSLCFVIAFMYQRNGSRYKFLPSLLAFAIAAASGAEWLEVTGSIILHNDWPRITPLMNLALGVLLIISVRAKGNVSRILSHLRVLRHN